MSSDKKKKTTTEWTGSLVSIGYDRVLGNAELGLRSDGVLVWRKAEHHIDRYGSPTGCVADEVTHEVRRCPHCNHKHPHGERCGKCLRRERKGNTGSYCICRK